MKNIILVLKIAGSLALIGVLFYLALNTPDKRKTFSEMVAKLMVWRAETPMLALGFFTLLLAILITIVRWCYLVRALDIDLSLRDCLRIGFLGYLFNLAPLGIVGGDIVKAGMLAWEKKVSRAKSLASVIVDRIIGLYVLFLVAFAGVFIAGLWQSRDPVIHGICIAVFIATGVATAGVAIMLIPGVLGGPLTDHFAKIPKVGGAIKGLFDAIKIYRTKRAVLLWTTIATVPVHVLLAVSIYFLAVGLGFREVPVRDYFGIYPVSGILSTIPLPAGPQETGIVFLYKTADVAHGAADGAAQQEGLILALVYRLSTILIAPIGAAYYFLGARGEVDEVMHHQEDGDEPTPA